MRKAMRAVGYGLTMVLSAGSADAAPTAWQTVRCAARSSFLINAKGDLYATGLSTTGMLGDRQRGAFPLYRSKWKKVLTKVRDVSALGVHSATLRSNGTIWLAGSNTHGQIARPVLGERFSSWKQSRLPTRAKVVGIAAGGLSSYAVTADGALWVTGVSELGTQTLPNETMKFSSKWQQTLQGVVSVRATAPGAYAWRGDGSVWRIPYYLDAARAALPGSVVVNLPGVPTPTTLNLPSLPASQWNPVTLVPGVGDARESTTVKLLTATGDVYLYTDYANDGIPDDQVRDNVYSPAPASNYLIGSGFTAFDAQVLGVFAVTTGGQLQQWIDRHDDPATHVPVPAHWEPALDQVRSFCVGEKHAMAIRTDGTVWGAGGNESGQFGNGSTTSTAGVTDWVQILR